VYFSRATILFAILICNDHGIYLHSNNNKRRYTIMLNNDLILSSSSYISKYPKIVIDENDNSPNSNMKKTLTIEEFYDLMHHTHNAKDIIGLNTGNNNSSSDSSNNTGDNSSSSEEVAELKEQVKSLSMTVEDLQDKVQILTETLTSYMDNDIGVADYDATTPGIQDEYGNTI
jgi:hypothetical protein